MAGETGNVKKFMERGMEAQKAVDQIAGRDRFETDTRMAIALVHAMLVSTEDEETRMVQCRQLLKLLQGMERNLPKGGQ